jgi:hypothetical protein
VTCLELATKSHVRRPAAVLQTGKPRWPVQAVYATDYNGGLTVAEYTG